MAEIREVWQTEHMGNRDCPLGKVGPPGLVADPLVCPGDGDDDDDVEDIMHMYGGAPAVSMAPSSALPRPSPPSPRHNASSTRQSVSPAGAGPGMVLPTQDTMMGYDGLSTFSSHPALLASPDVVSTVTATDAAARRHRKELRRQQRAAAAASATSTITAATAPVPESSPTRAFDPSGPKGRHKGHQQERDDYGLCFRPVHQVTTQGSTSSETRTTPPPPGQKRRDRVGEGKKGRVEDEDGEDDDGEDEEEEEEEEDTDGDAEDATVEKRGGSASTRQDKSKSKGNGNGKMGRLAPGISMDMPTSTLMEVALYVITGILLIFVMEQFVQIGMRIGMANAYGRPAPAYW